MRNRSSNTEATVAFETALGWIGLRGTNKGVQALTFGHSSEEEVRAVIGTAESADEIVDWMSEARELLESFAHGEPVDLSGIPLDVPCRTRFEKCVRDRLLRLGYGQVISYGELAEAAGAKGAARAVGNIMARNPVPLIIPCHRVVGSGGKLGGYSAPSGLAMKRRLLDLEAGAAVLRR